ncbi:MAG: DUF368 domain-containing protein [Chlamydiales bacterium]|nr:DUF368 domain-containing protein [Chlamydiales bacterium]
MFKKHLKTFMSGMCVGAADIVPGISGGTVAFIIGIYEDLLASIASFNGKAFGLLLRGKITDFFKAVNWQFLCVFVLGAVCSFVTLAKGFQYCLNHEALRPLLYSTFMGLVVGSVIFCAKLLPYINLRVCACALFGAISAYLLSGTNLGVQQASVYSTSMFIDPWIVLCGSFAISAMLLPGISGSYILNILGMYGPILGAVVTLTDHLRRGTFDTESFSIVASMVTGICLGALVFARVVRYLLAKYRTATIATLVGFMVGALKCVWPFWTYSYDATKHTLQVIDPILPDFASLQFVQSLAFLALGVGLVFSVEYIAKNKNLPNNA